MSQARFAFPSQNDIIQNQVEQLRFFLLDKRRFPRVSPPKSLVNMVLNILCATISQSSFLFRMVTRFTKAMLLHLVRRIWREPVAPALLLCFANDNFLEQRVHFSVFASQLQVTHEGVVVLQWCGAVFFGEVVFDDVGKDLALLVLGPAVHVAYHGKVGQLAGAGST